MQFQEDLKIVPQGIEFFVYTQGFRCTKQRFISQIIDEVRQLFAGCSLVLQLRPPREHDGDLVHHGVKVVRRAKPRIVVAVHSKLCLSSISISV